MKIQYPTILFIIAGMLTCRSGFGQANTKGAPQGFQVAPQLKSVSYLFQFANQLETDVRNDNFHGSISAAVVKNGQIIWAGAVGEADREKNIPADTNTIYRIGSITKTFTSTLLMMLVEDKKIKLDDLAETYVPEVKSIQGYNDKTRFTIRQLASHTAGLNREPDKRTLRYGPVSQWESILLQTLPDEEFHSKPGKEYLYSNVGFAILGLALERAAGIPYTQMIQDRILTPLHMDQTFFQLTDDKRPRVAEGLDNDNEEGKMSTQLPLNEQKGRGFRVPNGSLYSTPLDLAKFAMSLIGKPALLSPKSRRQMQDIPSAGKNYGLGLMIINSNVINAIAHNGEVPGYTAEMAIEQDSGYAVILLRNYNKGLTDLDRTALLLLKQLKQAD